MHQIQSVGRKRAQERLTHELNQRKGADMENHLALLFYWRKLVLVTSVLHARLTVPAQDKLSDDYRFPVHFRRIFQDYPNGQRQRRPFRYCFVRCSRFQVVESRGIPICEDAAFVGSSNGEDNFDRREI